MIVKTEKDQGGFIRNLIGDFEGRVSYYFDSMDIGIVLKENSLEIDKEKLRSKVKEYLLSFEEKVIKELEFLHLIV